MYRVIGSAWWRTKVLSDRCNARREDMVSKQSVLKEARKMP